MIVCQAAVDRFMSIVSSLGGPMELQRARLVTRLSRHYLSDYAPILYIYIYNMCGTVLYYVTMFKHYFP